MKGVLLVNLGSPYSTETKDVRDYLGEFLMDERVIDLPKWFRSFLVKGIILKTRPKKSAKAYRKIWWKEGSPLIVLSERLQKKVQKKDFLKMPSRELGFFVLGPMNPSKDWNAKLEAYIYYFSHLKTCTGSVKAYFNTHVSLFF